MLRKWLVGVVVGGAVAVGACATGTINTTPDATTPSDSGPAVDGSGCPQFDLMTDPKHCGSCTNACSSSQVCTNGACKAQCDAPQIKCADDAGGGGCVDPTKDPSHCGSCSVACGVGDAGGLLPGPNNPDAGIFGDAGYDGGPGWSVATATCSNSACGVSCPNGMTACADEVCYDTQNFHDHCGDCNTACQSTEWCTQGHCCATGTQWCTSQCVDMLNDANNCGSCGHVCPSQTPVCGGGVCTNGVTYTQTFTQGQVPTTQCTAWQSFIASLGSGYTSMTLSGSLDTTGITCTDPTVVNAMANALKNVTAYTGTCNGHTWSNCNRYNDELWIDPPAQCSPSNCPNPGYLLRACFGSANIWGCVNCNTCAAPTETVTLQFK